MNKIKGQKTTIYSVLAIIGIFLLLAISGCFDFVNLQFNFEKWKTASYWNDVITQVLMYTLALLLGYIVRMQNEMLTNTEFDTAYSLYFQYLAYKTESFIVWIETIVNPKLKKETYKSSIENKLSKLDRKTKNDAWILEYDLMIRWLATTKGKPKDYEVSDNILKNTNGCKNYLLKRFVLEALICDANIDANCRNFTKYNRINPNAFTYGIRKRAGKDDGTKVTSTEIRDMGKGMSIKAVSTLLTALVIGSIAGDPDKNELLEQVNGMAKFIVKHCFRVASVIYSYISGIYLGRNIFYNNYIVVIQNRNEYLAKYIDWQTENKEKETESCRIRKEALNNSIIEQTSENEPKIKRMTQEEKEKQERSEIVNELFG